MMKPTKTKHTEKQTSTDRTSGEAKTDGNLLAATSYYAKRGADNDWHYGCYQVAELQHWLVSLSFQCIHHLSETVNGWHRAKSNLKQKWPERAWHSN